METKEEESKEEKEKYTEEKVVKKRKRELSTKIGLGWREASVVVNGYQYWRNNGK